MKTNSITTWKVLASALFALSLLSATAQTELIVNGGFESGSTGWTFSGASSSANGGFARSGTYFCWLGGAVSHSDLAYQTITIPANATAATRADYHQVWIQVVGVDADFRLADSPAELDKVLEGLTPGATVNFKMRAVNETGPGPFGEPVQASVT